MLPIAILSGGLGTRLLPRTEQVPKALVEVNGVPFIHHQLRLLYAEGIRRAVLCVGHLGDIIEAELGDGTAFGLEIAYSYDGPTRIGTGGAVRKALPLLGDAFFVTYGDSYLLTDYAAVEEAFVRSGRLGLMTVWRNCGELAPSNVEVRDGEITSYDKKAPSDAMQYIDWGLSIFQARAFDGFAKSEAFDLGDVHSRLLETHQLARCEVRQRFYEVGSHKGLAETERLLNDIL
jgi:N-acetyl-alpha-D-muramate 1-phosphate uridylyltransferase